MVAMPVCHIMQNGCRCGYYLMKCNAGAGSGKSGDVAANSKPFQNERVTLLF